MSVTFSVVIPTYEREATIARAIDSALDQEHAPHEIVVVDDGSSDGTARVIQGFGGRVRYLPRAHGGVSAARNAGIRAATSEWIAFLDSDDRWLPGHLSTIARAIDETAGRAACYFADALFPGPDGPRSYWQMCSFQVPFPHQVSEDAGTWALLPVQPMLIPASVFRRSVLTSLGGFDERLAAREDTLLFHQIGAQYPMCAVRNSGTEVRDDAASRLTTLYDARHATYWTASIVMYRSLLMSPPALTVYERNVIARRLSDAHADLALLQARAGDAGRAIRNLGAALRASPFHFARAAAARAVGKTMRTWTRRTRRSPRSTAGRAV